MSDDLLHEREAAGAAPATVNNLRAQLRTVFSKAKKAGRWFGDNPLDSIERRKVPKRAYRTLSPVQIGRMLAEVPEDWRPLFACAALGLRKGELFALRKSDVDLARGTITVARSHDRDSTKGGVAAVLPLPSALRPWIEHQLEHAPGPLVFPPRTALRESARRTRRRSCGTRWHAPASWMGTSTAAAGAGTRSAPATPSRVSARPAARPRTAADGGSLSPVDGACGPSRSTSRSASTICATRSPPSCSAAAWTRTASSASCGTATFASRSERTRTCSSKISATRPRPTPRCRTRRSRREASRGPKIQPQ